MLIYIVNIALTLALLAKAASGFLKLYSPNPLWFHISGISSGILVLLGLVWAIVFFQGNNFARMPKVFKLLLPAAALLAIIAALLSK